MKHKTLSDKYQVGQLVRSRRGRDLGKLYIVTAVSESVLYVANGIKWTVSQPKKKNPLHLQKINHLMDAELTDTNIMKLMHTFENGKENQEDK